MKRQKISSSIILATLSFFTLIACSNQNPPNSNTSKASLNVITKTKKDTVPKLNFESMVRSIFQDSNGFYWFGSDYEGVCRFNGITFTYFTTEDGLKHNQIRTIQEDQKGNIWFATGYGLSKFDGREFTNPTAKQFQLPNILSENNWKKEVNDLWFNGELEGGIYRYDGNNLSILEFPILDLDHESFSITGTVTGISEGKNNMLWIANYGGVIGYNGHSFTFINERGFEYHVRSILEDSKGNLWIGNNGIGVLLYDGNKTINFTKEKEVNDINSIYGGVRSPKNTLNHVFSIAEDKDGNIWFGDRDTGAWRYDGTTLVNFTTEDGLTNTFVRTIYKDKKGDLWLGLEGGNVCKFNGKSFDKMF